MGNLQEEMRCSEPYWQFNREERNYTALLYHALLSGQNLWRFLYALQAQGFTPSHWGPAEPERISMYVEYALPRDLWARQAKLGAEAIVNAQRRQAVLDLLGPANRDQLEAASTAEWNTYFGANPASDKWIQFPGRWQIKKFNATIADDNLTGDVAEAAARIIATARQASKDRPACLIFGGETTVTLRGKGLGGRNQELALRVAMDMPALDRGWVFLSGGTDGRDGPTEAAGGIVDAGTCDRIRRAGGDPQALLDENDSNRALSLAGDLLVTGATGTNVADVQILLLT